MYLAFVVLFRRIGGVKIGTVAPGIEFVEQIAVGDADAAFGRRGGVGHLGHLVIASRTRRLGPDQISQWLAGERVGSGWRSEQMCGGREYHSPDLARKIRRHQPIRTVRLLRQRGGVLAEGGIIDRRAGRVRPKARDARTLFQVVQDRKRNRGADAGAEAELEREDAVLIDARVRYVRLAVRRPADRRGRRWRDDVRQDGARRDGTWP